MRILVLNGPNLNLLGNREAGHYGTESLSEIENRITKEFSSHQFTFVQSNKEGELVEKIQEAPKEFDGLIINPGGYAHTSVAIKDALEFCSLRKIEVHLSNLAAREDFRQTLITASSCDGYISGFKANSYVAAVFLLEKIFSSE